MVCALKVKNALLPTRNSLFYRPQPHSDNNSTHLFFGRTFKQPMDVRAYILRTYVHRPLARTSIRLSPYVHRKIL